MKVRYLALMTTLALGGVAQAVTQHGQHTHPAPQAEAAATSALTAEAVQQLLNGEGMGLARAAELNGYPGPKHVLELKTELSISDEQARQIEAIRQRMLEKAKPLGRQIVDAERALDAAFTSGRITEAELARQVAAIAKLQGELRLAHLQAHVDSYPVLSDAQKRKYGELRSKHH